MKSLLVGLDLTEMDANLIRYASIVTRDFDLSNVYFIHVERNLELPEKVIKEYDEVITPVDEGIRQKIDDEVDKYFNPGVTVDVHISVKEGNPVEKILRYSKIKNVDIILLGRKVKLRGSGVVTNSITRKSPCHLLLVPEDLKVTRIKKVLVPVDFSEHAARALDLAVEFANKEKAKVTCVNVYSVPAGYSKIGKTYEEFADIIHGHSKRDFADFISKYDQPIKCEFLLSDDKDYAEEIVEFVEEVQPDIVFVGSKGRTNAAVILLGSIAEKLTLKLVRTPLFVVKEKGENMNFFEALLKI